MRPLLVVVAALWALENLDPRVLDWPFVPLIPFVPFVPATP